MVLIIGAGPVGSYLGYLLSKENVSNTLVEEHKAIGRPEQCTGLISRNIEDIMPLQWVRKAVQNKVKGAVISCGKASFEVCAKDTKAYVFNRQIFDSMIAEKAVEKGSKLLLSAKYRGHTASGREIKAKVGSRSLQSKILVGADGPNSSVARNSGLYGKRRFWTGYQVIAKTKDLDRDIVQVYLDRKYSDGFFAWLVPLDEETAKIGLASFTDTSSYMKRFLRTFKSARILERHAGIIPVYQRIPLQNREKNIFLAGDAALQVKATSGGGVVNGMLAAQELCRAISEGSDYERNLGYIRRNLWLHSFMRKKLNSMDDQKRSELLEKLSSESVKSVLREKGDMDFPKKFLFKVMLSKPSLMKFLL